MRHLLPALLAVTTLSLSAAERPHLVVILADDMGYDAVSANNPEGMGPLKTPHIDRLIRQGMNFTDAHSGSAVCTPTRYGLLTGRYCWRTALKREVLWDYGRPLIDPQRLTLPEFLQQHGYHTGMVGKWHLGLDWFDGEGRIANADVKITDAVWKKEDGARERIKAAESRIDFSRPFRGGPLDHGFDYWFGVDVPNFPPYTFCHQDRVTRIPVAPKPEEMFGTEGLMAEGWQLEPILPTLADKACTWIRDQAGKDHPFFLYLSLTSPHTPIAPSEEWQGRSGLTRFADFLLQTDAVVGQVMETLEAAGVAGDTLLIFTTDNGTSAFRGQINQLEKHGVDLRRTLKGVKGQLAEGGHRVPFVARWPGRIAAGTSCAALTCLNDLFATCAELLGHPLPNTAAEDSTSILPLLTGRADTLPDRPWVVHHDYKGRFAIRDRGWKLVEGDPPELYHLTEDLKETTNLADAHPERVRTMQARLDHYRASGRSR